MKQMGFHLVPGRKTPFMKRPITVTVASLKTNRGKWLRFVNAYLEATQYMTTNKEGSIDVLKRISRQTTKETLDHAYEQMRARATVDLIPPEAAVRKFGEDDDLCRQKGGRRWIEANSRTIRSCENCAKQSRDEEE